MISCCMCASEVVASSRLLSAVVFYLPLPYPDHDLKTQGLWLPVGTNHPSLSLTYHRVTDLLIILTLSSLWILHYNSRQSAWPNKVISLIPRSRSVSGLHLHCQEPMTQVQQSWVFMNDSQAVTFQFLHRAKVCLYLTLVFGQIFYSHLWWVWPSFDCLN